MVNHLSQFFPSLVAFGHEIYHSNRNQTRTEIGTRGWDVATLTGMYAVGCCAEEGGAFWNFGLEKPVSAQSLKGCCGNLEGNAEDGSLPHKV